MWRRIVRLITLLLALGALTGARLDVREEDADEFYPANLPGLWSMFAGAPRFSGFYRDSSITWTRQDVNPTTWWWQEAPFEDLTGSDGLIITFGATDTSRQAGDVEYPSMTFGPAGNDHRPIFRMCAYDSSEGVFMSKHLGEITATSDVWFYAKFSPWLISAQYIAMGLVYSLNQFTPRYGTLY